MLILDHYMPRGACMRWEPVLIWWNTITDLAIFAAYIVMPLCIIFLATTEVGMFPRSRIYAERILGRLRYPSGIPWVQRLRHIGWLAALFILFCGVGHLIDVFAIWIALPVYKTVWNTGTAIASWATGLAVLRHFPYFVKLIRQVVEFQKNSDTI